MKPQHQASEEIIEGLVSVLPVFFLIGLFSFLCDFIRQIDRVIIMAVRKVKGMSIPSSLSRLKTYNATGIVDKVSGRPKPNFFKILFKQWQTWVILAILVGVIIVSIINANNQVVITGHEPLPQQSVQVQPVQQQGSQDNATNVTLQNVVVTSFTQVLGGVGSYMSLIVLLIVLGFIVGLFIKLSNMFK
jgi:hypothetical protein